MSRILIVEDNEELAFGLSSALRQGRHDVRVVYGGHAALRELAEFAPDLVLLDVGLPDLDGFSVLQRLREGGDLTPVLILTARNQDSDVVRGLQLGADDYVAKPFNFSVLLARVSALLRRSSTSAERSRVVEVRTLRIDLGARTVERDGIATELTPKEFDLLAALVQREGVVATREQLLKEVWGYLPDVQTRTVDIHVRQLRSKIERDPGHPEHVITVWGVGYRFVGDDGAT